MFCSILNWRLRDAMAGQSIGDIFDISRIILTLTSFAMAFIVLFINIKNMRRAFSLPIFFLFMYGIVAMLSSVLVDEAASFYALWKAIELIVMLFVMLATMSTPDPHGSIVKAYELVVCAIKILILVYIVQAIIWPNEAFSISRGVLPMMMHGVRPVVSENGLTFYSAVVILSCFAAMHAVSRPLIKVSNFFTMSAATVTLILAQSRTSIVGLFVALLVFIFLKKKKSIIFVFTILVLGLVLIELSSIILEFLRRGQDKNLLYSLSGRTIAWSMGWELFKESPIFGHGFVAGARAKVLGGGMSTMHGAVFDVLVGMGLLGLFTWGSAIILSCFSSLRLWMLSYGEFSNSSRVRHAEMLSLFALILIRTTTNSGLAMHDHVFMLFLCFMGYAQISIFADKNMRRENASY